jgi:hypothetical protein
MIDAMGMLASELLPGLSIDLSKVLGPKGR